MSQQRYTPEFKDEAVRQIIERGYSVAEVSERLGVSAHSMYKWVKAVRPDKKDQQAAEKIARRCLQETETRRRHRNQRYPAITAYMGLQGVSLTALSSV